MNILQRYSLDTADLESTDCVRWSLDNHIAVVCKKYILLLTPPFAPLVGSKLGRVRIDLEAGRQAVSVQWSPYLTDNYHHLAVLTDDGVLRMYRPRFDPAWFKWVAYQTVVDLKCSCFGWTEDRLMFGCSDGSVVDSLHGLVSKRDGHVPLSISSTGRTVTVGWSDGCVQQGETILVDDGIWGSGPFFSVQLFSKCHYLYKSCCRHQLPQLSPIVGLTNLLVATADGCIYPVDKLEETLKVDLDHLNGLAEVPGGGYFVALGSDKKQPFLTFFSYGKSKVTDSLAGRWTGIQQSHDTPMPERNETRGKTELLKKCVYCKSFCHSLTNACSFCGAYAYSLDDGGAQ